MEAGFPERPVIGLLLRLVYQHYAQSVDAALREVFLTDRGASVPRSHMRRLRVWRSTAHS
jgi:hypothetical protein